MKRANAITLLSISGIYFFSMFHRVAVPGTLFNEFQSSFKASAAEVAVLGSIYLYIYGLMQIFAGMISDRIGSSKTLLAGGGILAAGSLVFPFPGTIGFVYLARALIGLGASLIYISMLKHVNTFFPREDFTFILGISMVIGYAGGLAGTYPLERAAAHAGWQVSFFTAGILCLILVIFLAFRLRCILICRDCSFSLESLKGIIRNKAIYPVIFSGSIVFAVYFVIQATIGKKMLEDVAGLTPSAAALFTFSMMIIVMASILFHGYMGKRTRKRKLFSVMSSGSVLTGVVLIILNLRFFTSLPLFFISYFLCAWAGGGNILNPAIMKELNPNEAAGTAVGTYSTIMFLTVAAVGHLSGKVMDLFEGGAEVSPDAVIYPVEAYSVIFLFCLGLGVISLAFALAIRENTPGTE